MVGIPFILVLLVLETLENPGRKTVFGTPDWTQLQLPANSMGRIRAGHPRASGTYPRRKRTMGDAFAASPTAETVPPVQRCKQQTVSATRFMALLQFLPNDTPHVFVGCWLNTKSKASDEVSRGKFMPGWLLWPLSVPVHGGFIESNCLSELQ